MTKVQKQWNQVADPRCRCLCCPSLNSLTLCVLKRRKSLSHIVTLESRQMPAYSHIPEQDGEQMMCVSDNQTGAILWCGASSHRHRHMKPSAPYSL